MKKRDLKSLKLRKKYISKLKDKVKGGYDVPLTIFFCNTKYDNC